MVLIMLIKYRDCAPSPKKNGFGARWCGGAECKTKVTRNKIERVVVVVELFVSFLHLLCNGMSKHSTRTLEEKFEAASEVSKPHQQQAENGERELSSDSLAK